MARHFVSHKTKIEVPRPGVVSLQFGSEVLELELGETYDETAVVVKNLLAAVEQARSRAFERAAGPGGVLVARALPER